MPLAAVVIAVLLLVTILAAGCGRSADEAAIGPVTDVAAALGGQDTEGYARADSIRDFGFPEDHGPHPEFRNEWWYFTGNLEDDESNRYGFQLTFFKIAMSPIEPERESAWATNQAYMAHFAITDAQRREFHGFERFSRGAVGLAGAQVNPFKVWLEDWQVSSANGNDIPWTLKAREGGIGLSLDIAPLKDIVLQGDRGLSQKSAEPGNASYYYSITRLAAEGSISLEGRDHRVSGTAWLDREWSTSALDEGQVGWDWFALQFEDGTDLMYYQLRRTDGTIDPHSQGIIVDPEGNTTRIYPEDIELEVIDTWQSPRGGSYPLKWRARIKPLDETVVIRKVIEGQEQNLTVRYWEGAIDILNEAETHPLGWGYMELTAYGGR